MSCFHPIDANLYPATADFLGLMTRHVCQSSRSFEERLTVAASRAVSAARHAMSEEDSTVVFRMAESLSKMALRSYDPEDLPAGLPGRKRLMYYVCAFMDCVYACPGIDPGIVAQRKVKILGKLSDSDERAANNEYLTVFRTPDTFVEGIH